MSDSTFTFRVDDELKAAFAAAARAEERTSAQLLRTLMRDAVRQQQERRDHDAWFRTEVEQGLREADDPAVGRLSQNEVRGVLRSRGAKRGGSKTR